MENYMEQGKASIVKKLGQMKKMKNGILSMLFWWLENLEAHLPTTSDLQILVKMYLNKAEKTIRQDDANMPGKGIFPIFFYNII